MDDFELILGMFAAVNCSILTTITSMIIDAAINFLKKGIKFWNTLNLCKL